MKPKIIDSHFTAFWGVFLNLECNLHCPYCIQKISSPAKPLARYALRSGKDWVVALNAIAGRTKRRFLRPARLKKLSLLGGEPTLHPDFLYLINNLDRYWKITVTSNFDAPFFEQDSAVLRKIRHKGRLRFNGSLHFLHTPIERFIANVRKLQKAGIGVHTLFVVAHPGHLEKAQQYQQRLLKVHRRVKLQRFLGFHQEELYPRGPADAVEEEQKDGISNYALYREGFSQKGRGEIFCHSDKVLVAPNGDIYNCHYKVYTGHKDKMGNLFDQDVHVHIPREYFCCCDFGFCNPCDCEGHLYKRDNGVIESISAAPDNI
ncbi:MAG: radical SAM protein [Candidatus Omnitrophota bacterium]